MNSDIPSDGIIQYATHESYRTFDDNVERVQNIIDEYGLTRKIISFLAMQMTNAFEEGYKSGFFDGVAVSRCNSAAGGDHQ
jgi:hypothetical protein